ncbi:hypothetical protein O9992_10905 [Vibrio lentus]|nr:hypothetical protein [Vibrio lentus]
MAREQVENGAQIIDINMDEGIHAEAAWLNSLIYVLRSEISRQRRPWSTLQNGKMLFKTYSGKGIVNSISLKEGKEKFVER